MRRPRIELGATAWKAAILPLNQRRILETLSPSQGLDGNVASQHLLSVLLFSDVCIEVEQKLQVVLLYRALDCDRENRTDVT